MYLPTTPTGGGGSPRRVQFAVPAQAATTGQLPPFISTSSAGSASPKSATPALYAGGLGNGSFHSVEARPRAATWGQANPSTIVTASAAGRSRTFVHSHSGQLLQRSQTQQLSQPLQLQHAQTQQFSQPQQLQRAQTQQLSQPQQLQRAQTQQLTQPRQLQRAQTTVGALGYPAASNVVRQVPQRPEHPQQGGYAPPTAVQPSGMSRTVTTAFASSIASSGGPANSIGSVPSPQTQKAAAYRRDDYDDSDSDESSGADATEQAAAVAAVKDSSVAKLEISSDLHVEVVCAKNLSLPEHRFGDRLRGFLKEQLNDVYVEVQLGPKVFTTAPKKYASEQALVRFTDERTRFPYRGEKELRVFVRDKRHVQAAVRGSPLIGSAVLQLHGLRTGAAMSMEVELSQGSTKAGTLVLQLQQGGATTAKGASNPWKNLAGDTRRIGFLLEQATQLDGHGEVFVKAKASSGKTPAGKSFAFDEPPSQWKVNECEVSFSLYSKGSLSPTYMARCLIPLRDLLHRPKTKLMLFQSDNNALWAKEPPHMPAELTISLVEDSLPAHWPKPQEDEDTSNNRYPKHIFMMTRGTRGDVQPFVALARGLAQDLGWMVTICTEMRWQSFVKDNATGLRQGRIRFRPSGGDTEARMSGWVEQQAVACKNEFMQMMMMSNSEAEFFPSTPVFVQHVLDFQQSSTPVDLVVFAFTVAGAAAIISEHCQIPIVGFIFQPSCIPSKEESWKAVEAIRSHSISLLDQLEEQAFTSHTSLALLKQFAEKNPAASWNIDRMRGWFGLPPIDTWKMFKKMNVPIIIPMRPGTFKRPSDWWSGIEETDFIFLRKGSSGSKSNSLAEPCQSFVSNAREAGAKLCLMTFSSMIVRRSKVLRCAAKMVSECPFNARLIYVGKPKGEAPAEILPLVEQLQKEGRLLCVEKADFGELFRHIDCFVVHGGLGTTVEALRCGRPTCVTGPLLLDQRFWGSVCNEKGVGPEPVHIDDFEKTCLDFVNGALDPKDPRGWQATAASQRWGDESDDGVWTNVEACCRLQEKLGRFTLRVQLQSALRLAPPASVLNNAVAAVTGPSASMLENVYAVVSLNGRCQRTAQLAASPDLSVNFMQCSPVNFTLTDEDELTVALYNQRHVLGNLRGDSFIGSATTRLSDYPYRESQTVDITMELEREGEKTGRSFAGILELQFRVLDRDSMVIAGESRPTHAMVLDSFLARADAAALNKVH
eukprot:TRINITY_DN23119_c0_g1_i3.p1 TRINITY_DN23119_c0_g1~~TRINITY_DN23119_c0_g1_i3.p1  ORF type:complete len:1218 (+),score=272.76 TRINITY_DN23119_c0_g1_i3:82-3735(+)